MEQERLITNRTAKFGEACGRSWFYLICPWCGTRVRCFCWSFAAVGKRCPACGALHQPSDYSRKEVPSELKLSMSASTEILANIEEILSLISKGNTYSSIYRKLYSEKKIHIKMTAFRTILRKNNILPQSSKDIDKKLQQAIEAHKKKTMKPPPENHQQKNNDDKEKHDDKEKQSQSGPLVVEAPKVKTVNYRPNADSSKYTGQK